LKNKNVIFSYKHLDDSEILAGMGDLLEPTYTIKVHVNKGDFFKFKEKVKSEKMKIQNKKKQLRDDALKKEQRQRKKEKRNVKNIVGLQNDILFSEDVAAALGVNINTIQNKKWREKTGCPLEKKGKRLYTTKKLFDAWMKRR